MCFEMLIADQQARGAVVVNRAKYKVQAAKNERSGAESAVAKWGQSLSNQKKLKAGGENFNILAENFSRTVDARTLDSAMGMLRHGEDLGRLTAAAASAGIGGSSIESYNRTVETGFALQREAEERSARSGDYVAAKQAGRALGDAVDSMDNNLYMADQDYSYLGETKGPSILGTLATVAVAAAATAAGAPQAGQAIIDAKTSSLQANYGLGDGGVAAMQSAVKNFKGGVGEVRDMTRSNAGTKPNSFSGGYSNFNINSGNVSRAGPITGGITFR